jgi:TBC1 domain family member 6
MQEVADEPRTCIAKDVPRSFPEYVFFQDKANRDSLQSILNAYAACDEEVGYCQGLNFLAGCILLYCPRPEEAFATLHMLLKHHDMRTLYLPRLLSAQV